MHSAPLHCLLVCINLLIVIVPKCTFLSMILHHTIDLLAYVFTEMFLLTFYSYVYCTLSYACTRNALPLFVESVLPSPITQPKRGWRRRRCCTVKRCMLQSLTSTRACVDHRSAVVLLSLSLSALFYLCAFCVHSLHV